MKQIFLLIVGLLVLNVSTVNAQDVPENPTTEEIVKYIKDANPTKEEVIEFIQILAKQRNMDPVVLMTGKMDLAGTWNFVSIAGQDAPAGTFLKFSDDNTGAMNIGQGEMQMSYTSENFVIKISIQGAGESVSMEVLEYQKDFLKMRDQNDGTVVELKR